MNTHILILLPANDTHFTTSKKCPRYTQKVKCITKKCTQIIEKCIQTAPISTEKLKADWSAEKLQIDGFTEKLTLA